MLLKEIEELREELKKEREYSSTHKQHIAELSENLEYEAEENKTLWDQVEYLTQDHNKAKVLAKEQNEELRKERAKGLELERERIIAGRELEELKVQLETMKNVEENLRKKEKETRSELETLKVSFQDLKEECEVELQAAKMRTETFQQQLEFQEIIERLKAEQEAYKQSMEQNFRLLQQDVLEREKSFCREMEDLKVQFSEQMTTFVKDRVAEVLQAKAPHLRNEQTDKDSNLPEEEPLTNEEAPELLEETTAPEEKAQEKKKKKSLWKRFCHFFGLRRKKKQKGEKESTSI